MYLAVEGAWWRRGPVEVLLPLGAFGVVPTTVVVAAWAAGPYVVAITLFSPIAATLILLQMTLLVWVVGGFRSYAARVVRGRAVAGVCPACLYEMAGALVDQAGLCRCPECGGTWDTSVEEAKTVVVRWGRGEGKSEGRGGGAPEDHVAADDDVFDQGRGKLKGQLPLVGGVEKNKIGGQTDVDPSAVR